MEKVISFLRDISANNNRPWFEANKGRYQEANGIFNAFVDQLITGISRFDPSVTGLTAKDCTFRFYRDTRFSGNKDPYKTHFGAYICKGGRKSPYAGYYFHVEPTGNPYLGGNMLAAGIYAPMPEVLKSIREEIMLNGASFEETVRLAPTFLLEDDQALKKVPRGYPADSPWAEYLKFKNINLFKRVDDAFLLNPDALEQSIDAFHQTLAFNEWLNRAVSYALD